MANKPTPADFSPTVPDFPVIGQYQPIYGKFDLTTYIQGASDYEIMSFLVQCYNATLKGYSDVTQLSKDTVTAYNQLQTWVNTWFAELDVQQEINNKLQSMYEAGTLATAIAQSNTIPPAVAQYLNSADGTKNLSDVTAQKIEAMAASGALGTVINNTGTVQSTTTNWLQQNVTPVGSAVVVDKTLSIKGAAADSKVCGDNIRNLIHDFSSIGVIPYDTNNYSNNLVNDIDYENGKTIPLSALNGLNINNYKEKMISSSVAAISDVYKIANGTIIKHSYSSTAINDALVCITFDKNGDCIKSYTGLTFDSNEMSTAAYALFIIYPKLSQEITYTFFNKEWITNNIEKTYEWVTHTIGKTYIVGNGGDYNTFTAAIKALQGDETVKTIKILPGEYDLYSEIGGDTFADAIASTVWRDWNTIIPKNTLIEGVGVVKLTFNCTSNNSKAISVLSPINAESNVQIKNLTIEANNCRYCVHYENSASTSYKNSVFGIYDCIISKTGNNIAAIGIGLETSSTLDIVNTTVQSVYYGIYIHTDKGSTNCQIKILNCLMENSSTNIAVLIDNIYATTPPEKASNLIIGGTSIVDKIIKRFNNTCDEWHIVAYRTNINAVEHTGQIIGTEIPSNIYA